MNKFSQAIEMLKKHYPVTINGDEPIIISLANMISRAGAEENEVEELCGLISDEFDDKFEQGLTADGL